MYKGIYKSIETSSNVMIFIPNEDCYKAEDTMFIETFRLITTNNFHKKVLDKCHEMIFSKYCLTIEATYNSDYENCFSDAKKISTEETTTEENIATKYMQTNELIIRTESHIYTNQSSSTSSTVTAFISITSTKINNLTTDISDDKLNNWSNNPGAQSTNKSSSTNSTTLSLTPDSSTKISNFTATASNNNFEKLSYNPVSTEAQRTDKSFSTNSTTSSISSTNFSKLISTTSTSNDNFENWSTVSSRAESTSPNSTTKVGVSYSDSSPIPDLNNTIAKSDAILSGVGVELLIMAAALSLMILILCCLCICFIKKW